MTRFLLSSLLLRVQRGARAISDQTHSPHRRLPAGRLGRSHHAHHRRRAAGAAGPAGGGREPPGRRQRDRGRAGGAHAARRLHPHVRVEQRDDRRGRAAQAADLRPAQGLHADLAGRPRDGVLLRAPVGAGEDAEGVRRARQGQSRQGGLRHRQPALDPLRPAAHQRDRHRRGCTCPTRAKGRSTPTSSPAACIARSSAPAPRCRTPKTAACGRSRCWRRSRSPLLPDVPTIAEAGVPEVTVRQWAGLYGPPNMPSEIVARLNKEVNAALKRPDVLEKLQSYGYAAEGSTPERLLEINRADLALWRKLVARSGNSAGVVAQRFDAIVIGTGQAGPALAARLSAAGQTVAVIERGKFGGTCVNDGCTPTKTLVASAYAAHLARRAAEYGVRISGKPRVDMKRVKARKDAVVRSSTTGVEKWMRGLERATLFRGHARFAGSTEIRSRFEDARRRAHLHRRRRPAAGAEDAGTGEGALPHQPVDDGRRLRPRAPARGRRQLHRAGIRADVPPLRLARHRDRDGAAPGGARGRGRVAGAQGDPRGRRDRCAHRGYVPIS